MPSKGFLPINLSKYFRSKISPGSPMVCSSPGSECTINSLYDISINLRLYLADSQFTIGSASPWWTNIGALRLASDCTANGIKNPE